jgi:tetratricopeptide (TPR) repeat protein
MINRVLFSISMAIGILMIAAGLYVGMASGPTHLAGLGLQMIILLAVLMLCWKRISIAAILIVAESARKKKDYAKALNLSLDAIKRYSKEPNFYIAACAAYAGMRQWNDAVEMAGKAIALDGKNPIAWNNRAYVYIQTGDFKAAQHDAFHAGECAKKRPLTPNANVVFQTRAAVFIWNCKYEEALADAEYLLAKRQGARGLYIRAVVMTCMNRFEEAIDCCDKALAATKDQTLRAHVLAARAIACDALCRHEEAITDMNIAVQEEPTYYAHRISRAHLHMRAGDYAPADSDLTAAEQSDLSTLEQGLLLSNKARLNILRGADSNEACRLADEALKLRPEAPSLLCTHAWAQKSVGNHTAALADLCKAIEIDQYHAEAYWLRSEVYAALGDEERSNADKAVADKYRYRPYALANRRRTEDESLTIRLSEKQSEART